MLTDAENDALFMVTPSTDVQHLCPKQILLHASWSGRLIFGARYHVEHRLNIWYLSTTKVPSFVKVP